MQHRDLESGGAAIRQHENLERCARHDLDLAAYVASEPSSSYNRAMPAKWDLEELTPGRTDVLAQPDGGASCRVPVPDE